VESLKPATRVVEAGGVTFFVRDWGEPGAPAVCFWHGLGGTGADLDSAAPLLAGGYGLRVLAPDAPGLGESPAAAVPDGYSSDASAAQAAALLDALELERAIFLGHSWGATVGCYLAARHGDRLSAMVLLDGGYLDLGDLPWAGPPPSFELLVELVRSGRGHARLEHTTPEVWAAVVDAGFRQPPSAVLGEIPGNVPVLLVAAGEPEDMAAVREERLTRFRTAVPHATIERMPGVSHNMLAEAGPEVAVIVGEWLSLAVG
jgi:pimeloyl-ACP methyl ester carboxylesterase